MLDARKREIRARRKERRETEGGTGQEKINRPANMCREKGAGGGREEGEGGRARRGAEGEKDGVERTHREARSHDLMNELAWLLGPVVGYSAPRSPCRADVFHPSLSPFFRAEMRERRARR